MQDSGYLFDYYGLWVFGRLTLEGRNPYDQTLIRETLRSLGISFNDPLSGNLPWSLWLHALYAAAPFPLARVLWFLTSLAAIAYFCFFSFQVLSKWTGTKLSTAQIALAVLSFSPTLNNLRWGQSNFVLALGLLGYIYYTSKNNSRAAGLALSFTLFKPHLFLPLYAYIVAQSLARKSITLPAFCAAGLLLQCLFTFALSPLAFESYPAEFLRSVSVTTNFLMPSLPLLLANYAGVSGLRLLLPILGIFAGFYLGLEKSTSSWRTFLLVLSFSLLLAPYSWSHTYLVLFIPYVWILEAGWKKHAMATTSLAFIFALLQYWISFDTYMTRDYLMICLPLLTSIAALAQAITPLVPQHPR